MPNFVCQLQGCKDYNRYTRGPWWPWITHLSHFPHKLNSTFFVTIGPTCGTSFDPRCIIWIKFMKVHKVMLHLRKQSSRPTRYREEEFWILPSLYLCSNMWPCGRANLDHRGIIWTNSVEVHKEMLHTKYQSCMPSIFREEEFWRWASLFLCSNLWPPGVRPVLTPGASYEQTL